MGSKERSDHDRRDCRIAEQKADSGAEQQGYDSCCDAKGDRPVPGAPEQREVDLETRKKHQQQLSQLRHEIGNRPHLAEDVEDKRSGNNAAEQQAYCRGNVQPTRYKRDDRKHRHPQGELRKHRQREQIFA